MKESQQKRGLNQVLMTRSQRDRAKSLREIDQQYSRIYNRLYRQYLDFEISEEAFWNRRRAIQDAYDRYQTNIMNTEVPGWTRGMGGTRNPALYNRPIARRVYARNNRT